MKTQLEFGHTRDDHCWSDQESKGKSKVTLEAPLEMEEINTEYYLIKDSIAWV